jgi:hypothetical protein
MAISLALGGLISLVLFIVMIQKRKMPKINRFFKSHKRKFREILKSVGYRMGHSLKDSKKKSCLCLKINQVTGSIIFVPLKERLPQGYMSVTSYEIQRVTFLDEVIAKQEEEKIEKLQSVQVSEVPEEEERDKQGEDWIYNLRVKGISKQQKSKSLKPKKQKHSDDESDDEYEEEDVPDSQLDQRLGFAENTM